MSKIGADAGHLESNVATGSVHLDGAATATLDGGPFLYAVNDTTVAFLTVVTVP